MKNQHFLAKVAFAAMLCISATSSAQQKTVQAHLGILSATPNGMTMTRDQSRAIVVMFDRPMVALQAVPRDKGSGPLVFEPPIKGKYRWLGTSTLTFIPADTLPNATAYRAIVPAGTKALDGSTLAADYVWNFETPRPQLVRSMPRNYSNHITLGSRIFLQFNQPMNPERAKGFITLTQHNSAGSVEIPFELRFPVKSELDQFGWDNLMKNIMIVVPRDSLMIESSYTLQLKEGLPGAVGNLGTATETDVFFQTYRRFKFLSIRSIRIPPDEPLIFRFSNPVSISELARHVDIQPPVEVAEKYSQYQGSSENVYFYLPLLSDTVYTVRISGALKDVYGNSLDSDAVLSAATTSYTPKIYMAGGEGIVESYGKLRYPVQLRNIDSFRLKMGTLNPDQVIPYFTNGKFNIPYTVDREIDPKIKRNVTAHYTFKVDKPLQGKNHGFVVAQVSDPSPKISYFSPSRVFLQVTDLALTAKFSPENNLVWVTRLENTEPVSNAEIQVRDDHNRVLWVAKTDSSGLAVTPGWGPLGIKPGSSWQPPRMWIFARDSKDSNDWAFTRGEDGTGISPWRFGIDYNWQPKYLNTDGCVFTDRGLYRAGETVNIKGILRQRIADNWTVRKNEFVLVTITDPMAEKVFSDSVELSDYGSFNISFKSKPEAHLGDYTVQVFAKKTGFEYAEYYDYQSEKPPEGMTIVSSGDFRIEAFRPAESEVNVRFLQSSYISGDTVSGTVSARYLFGAPMRNDKVTWRLRAFPGSYTPPGHEGFSFGSGWWTGTDQSETLLNSADTTLDKHGMLSISYPIGVGRLSGTRNLLLEATATSPSRRSVTGRASAILHGGQYYIGIKTSRFFMGLKDTLGFDLITVTPDGKMTPGRQLKVDVVRRQWISVRKAETDGRYYWQTDVLDSTVKEFSAVSRDSALHENFIPQASGYYLLKVGGKDSIGNSISSGESFYVTGYGYIAWERSNDDRIDLVADKKSYKPGDVARVMIKSPYEKARALVTIERDGILEQRSTVLVGSAPEIRIPIKEEFLPNVFVSAVLLQGRVAAETVKGEDIGRPSFKIGYIDLPVDPGTQHLKVGVTTDKEEYHPGDSIQVSFQIRDSHGKGTPSEITVSVADMGVLNLIGYSLPDPFVTFFGPRALGVTTSETIAHLVEQRSYGKKGEDQGGGGMAPSAVAMRGNFKFSAYWNGSVETDDSGKAVVRFKLPDNLSRFKVMAVAQTKKSEFGEGESTFRINKELLLQPALPRFARIDDRFDAGVLVTNYSKTKNKVTLLATVEKSVKMTGKKTVRFELEPGESREVRFNYIAASKVGSAKFNYQATMGKYSDGVTITLPVIFPRSRESVALYETTRDSANQALVIPSDIYSDIGELQFTASSTALSGLENSIDYLITYPYGCLEQRLSCIYPIILGEKMVKAFNLPVLRGEDMRKVAQRGIDEIPKYIASDGGLAYWKGDRYSYPYLTGYALVVLGKARERGYSLDQDMLSRIINYSSNFLRKSKNDDYFPWSEACYLATRAIMVYGLSLNGQQEPAYVERLYVQRNKLPFFAKAFLLETIHRNASNNPAMVSMENELVREFMNTAKVASTTAHFEEPDWEGLKWVFSTNTRTTAIVLQALLETGDRDPFLSKVVRWIMQEQRVGRWRSTQENVYVVAALSDYFEAFENEEPDFKASITVAGRKVLDSIFKGREFKTISESKPLSSFRQNVQLPIRIKKNGTGILYYGIRMNYYPTKDTLVRDEGIAVLKTITSIDGKPIPQTPDGEYVLSAGYMYKVMLTVIVPQERNFVVLDDPLPAGAETVNLTFQTESNYLGASVGEESDRWESMYWMGGFNHVEQKDDRVLLFASTLDAGVHRYSYLVRAATYGKFAMPSTHAEEMYTPDVFGGTSFRTVIVK